MNRVLLSAVLTAGLYSFAVGAAGIGLGATLGEPTGFSAKFWGWDDAHPTRAADLAVAWSPGGFPVHSGVQLAADFLLNTVNPLPREYGFLTFYVGLGAWARAPQDNSDWSTALRAPIGAEYVLPRMPIGWFVETVPAYDLLGSGGFSFGTAVGVRYYLMWDPSWPW